MSAVLPASGAGSLDDAQQKSEGVWHAAWRRFKGDRVGFWSMIVVLAFIVLIALSAVGVVAKNWQDEVGVPNAPPTFMGPAPPQAASTIEQPKGPNVDLSDIDPLAPRYKEWDEKARQFQTAEVPKRETLPFGADRLGRDVLSKAIKGTEISVFVGVMAALAATGLGTLLGALGGFFGGRIGDFLEWLYNVFESIPNILLIFAFAAVVGRGVQGVVIILALTGWTGMYRQVRAEFIKHRGREYVRAAEAIGASTGSRMFRHILPNVSHVILVRLALLVVGFIKYEVILSYLGLGSQPGEAEWGRMLSENQSLLFSNPAGVLAPALAIVFFATSVTIIGDWIYDRFSYGGRTGR